MFTINRKEVLDYLKEYYKLTEAQIELLSLVLIRLDGKVYNVCIHWYGEERIRINKSLKDPPYYISYVKMGKNKHITPIEYSRAIRDYEINYFHKANKRTLFSLIRKGIFIEVTPYEFILDEVFKRNLEQLTKDKFYHTKYLKTRTFY